MGGVTLAAHHLCAEEIAKHTGVVENSVHDLISRYKRFGAQAVEAPRSSKHRRCYLSKEEEVNFLSPFLEKAKRGEIATAAEIRRALEELLGHGIHHSTVYRLLQRNGWRKVVPRSLHVEVKQKVQEDFKKLPRARSQDPFGERSGRYEAGGDRGPGRTRFGRISTHRPTWAPPAV